MKMASWIVSSSEIDLDDLDDAGKTVDQRQDDGSNDHEGKYSYHELPDTGNSMYRVGDIAVDLINGERGHGSFGTVYEGLNTKTHTRVAVKKIVIKNLADVGTVMSEVEILKRIPPHANLVTMHDVQYREPAFWIVMEYCDLGDLQQYIVDNDPNLIVIADIMLQCALGLKHMHSLEVNSIHRDIKPANIMLKTGLKGQIEVKITDFGLTKKLDSNLDGTGYLQTNTGTVGFMAPELWARIKYTNSVDVFAMGLVFLSIIQFQSGNKVLFPRTENTSIMKAIGQEMYEAHINGIEQPTLISDQPSDNVTKLAMKQMIREMSCFKSTDRLSMIQVVSKLEQIQPRRGVTPVPRIRTSIKVRKPCPRNNSLETTPPPVAPERKRSFVKSQKFKKFTTGDVVTVPQMNEYLQQRAMVMKYDAETNEVGLSFATGDLKMLDGESVNLTDMSGHVIDEGDMVMISADAGMLRKMHTNSGISLPAIEKLPGKAAIVETLFENNTAQVLLRPENMKETLNIQVLKLLFKAEDLEAHGIIN